MKISKHDWPEDFHLENGNYQNECTRCKKIFIGHKCRTTCRNCYLKPAIFFGGWEWVLMRLPDVESKWSWITILWIVLANPMIGLLYFVYGVFFLLAYFFH